MRATIGVHLVEDDASEATTLDFLARHTNPEHPVIVLRENDREGGAAAFNALCRGSETELVVLMESGCRPGPGWLEPLIETLAEDPCHGLSGPSTNRCWNEQGAFPQAGESDSEVAATATEAALTFQNRRRTLEPLYSLSDFCYAVRREVWTAVGEADESYGSGPCWEMDYNIRAARRGFHGFWVGKSYVNRAPEGPKRRKREQLLWDVNKRLYQTKFCGRQLRARNSSSLPQRPAAPFFRKHCSGDACPNFAPLPANRAIQTGGFELPLVTCLMPTSAGRRDFLPASIAMFLAQDYPRAELLILGDGPDPIDDLIPANPSIRYVHLDRKLSIGAKRNAGCELASGSLIAHWDDDDWYAPWRLTRQVEILREAGADICGTSVVYFFEPTQRRAFVYRYQGRDRWVYGNSLLYRVDFWRAHPFQDVTEGEDTLFVRQAWSQRVADLADPELAPARLHNSHTSPKATSGLYWRTIEAGEVEASLARHRLPLVSCLMPTYNRREFLPLSYELFRSQDYPRLELVIVDDSETNLCDEQDPELLQILSDPRVRYITLPARRSLGDKRNLACSAAKGDILVHWDDDDWYGRRRISYQLEPILSGEADITGLENSYTFEVENCQCWLAERRFLDTMFVGGVQGGTLAFHRSILGGKVSYPPLNLAEDAGLLTAARARGARFRALSNPGVYVYVRHASNTWRFDANRFIDAQWWTPTPPPAEMDGFVLERIQAASQASRGRSRQA